MKICYHCMLTFVDMKEKSCPVCGKQFYTGQADIRFLNAGTILEDKYLVGHPLGFGGFGITYVGWDKYLQRKVAIKEFYPGEICHRMTDHMTVAPSRGLSQDRFIRGKEKFLLEARNLIALNDIRGVVSVLNFFEANGTAYIVMEYVDGTNLAGILTKSNNKMNYPWCRKLILSVLYILHQIHSRGVLHLDISPDNIILTKDGIVKLIDFGAARNFTSTNKNPREVILKSGYSPIEQYSIHAEQGPYTDLYAVAALFYRMLTGIKPPTAYERMIQDTLVMPSKLGIKIPQQAEFAIMSCLSIQPQFRIQTAFEFMDALGGRDFVPVYDPQWIMPKGRDVNGFLHGWRWIPLSARIAMGVSAGIITISLITGGFLLTRPTETEIHKVSSSDIVMPNLSDMTLEEASIKIDALNQKNGYHLSVKEDERVFSSKQRKDGKIYSQSIPTDTDLSDETSVQQLMDENLYYDESGVLTGTVYCDVYTAEDLKYSDLNDKNAYEISEFMNEDINGEVFAKDENTITDKIYWEVESISLTDGTTITEQQLLDPKNADITLTKSSIDTITYYANKFFYWKELPDFQKEYGNIDMLESQLFDTYSYENETNLKPEGKSNLSMVMIDSNYGSFTRKQGSIISQTVKPGKEYKSVSEEPLKINVVGKSLSLTTPEGRDDAASVKAYLVNTTGTDPACIRFADASRNVSGDKVIGVKIYSADGKELSQDAFSTANPYYMVLNTEERKDIIPQETSEGSKGSEGTTASAPSTEKSPDTSTQQTTEKAKEQDVATPFYYWKQLPDFAQDYKNLTNLKKASFQTYLYDKKHKKVKQEKKALPDSMIDANYYSLFGKKGDLLGQSIEKGKKYNSSKRGDLMIYATGVVLLGEKPDLNSYTGSGLLAELQEKLKNCTNVSITILNPEFQENGVASIKMYEKPPAIPSVPDSSVASSEQPATDTESTTSVGSSETTTAATTEVTTEATTETGTEATTENSSEEKERKEIHYFKDNVIIEITCHETNIQQNTQQNTQQ